MHTPERTPTPSGVPDHVFRPGFKAVIVAESGAELGCTVTKDTVAVEDLTNVLPGGETFRLKAQTGITTIKNYEGKLRGLSLLVYMYDPTVLPQRQPDIHAASLLSQTIEYFDKQQPLDVFKGMWASQGLLNSNYTTFLNALNGQGFQAPENIQREAAFATWTGRQALQHGFDRVSVRVSYHPRVVHADFIRPHVTLE